MQQDGCGLSYMINCKVQQFFIFYVVHCTHNHGFALILDIAMQEYKYSAKNLNCYNLFPALKVIS